MYENQRYLEVQPWLSTCRYTSSQCYKDIPGLSQHLVELGYPFIIAAASNVLELMNVHKNISPFSIFLFYNCFFVA